MGSTLEPWLLIFTLVFLFNNPSFAKHEKKLPSAVVVGTVYCDTCSQRDFSKTSHFIPGASVSVECGDGGSRPSFHEEVKTNQHGVFKIRLPVWVSKHVKVIKQCSVKLISSSEPSCAVASSTTSSSLRLKSRKEGTHIFSAGLFTFKPPKQPEMCKQKPSFATSKDLSYNKKLFPYPDIPTFPPVTQSPTLPNLPPLPSLPNLPPLPTLPQIPAIPKLPPIPNIGQQPDVPIQPKATEFPKTSPSSDRKAARPTFFFSPPSIPFLPSPPPLIGIPLPPNPLQPPPLVPNPFKPPPPSIGFPPLLPPIPGLTPPPPPPTFPFPFPPFPFPPSPPGFPGIPPASTSYKTSP